MAANSQLDVGIGVKGEGKIDRLRRKLERLDNIMTGMLRGNGKNLDATNTKWKKHFDALDSGMQMVGKGLTKFVTFGAKFAAVQLGVLGASMMAVHAAFVLGNAAMKAFRWLAAGAAGAAAGLTIAASAAAAAIREQQEAMYAYKGGKNYQNASVLMRQLASDTDMAALGAENLNAVFAAVSKTSTFTASSTGLLKGLMDFASAGKPLEEGAKAAGALIAAIQDPKASFSKMKEAAKELGPEMEKALDSLGIDSAEKLKKAILDGTLAAAGGVDGQFAAVNETLISRFKSSFALIKSQFADFGEPFLKPIKEVLENIVRTFKRTFSRVSGDIAAFGNAGFFDDIGGFVEKVGNFFVNFIRDYLPRVEGMFTKLGDWWAKFKDGWNVVLDKLRPLIDGAKVIEETLMRVFRPIGRMFSEGFGDFNKMLTDNKEDFYAFGDAIGRFVVIISKYAKTVREIFMDALPFITKMIDGLSGLVDMFNSFLGGFRSLLGGSGFGSFMLIASLLAGGRSLKKTTGGMIASYGLADRKGVTRRTPLTGQTGEGNVTDDTAKRGRALAKTAQQVATQTVGHMTVASATIGGQQVGAYGRGGPGTPGTPGTPGSQRSARLTGAAAEQRRAENASARAQTQAIIAARRAGVDPVTGATIRKTGLYGKQIEMSNTGIRGFFNRQFRLNADAAYGLTEQGDPARLGNRFRARRQEMFRAPRDSLMYKRIFGSGGQVVGADKNGQGGRIYKGLNNTMGASIAASAGHGIASQFMPEGSQGAMALGSAVAMVNPLAGLAIGVVGGLVMGMRAAAAKRRKEARQAADSFAKGVAGDAIEGMQDAFKTALEEGKFSIDLVRAEQAKVQNQILQTRNGFLDFLGSDMDMFRTGAKDLMSQYGLSIEDVVAIDRGNFTTTDTRIAEAVDSTILSSAHDEDMLRGDKIAEVAKTQRMLGQGFFAEMDQATFDMAMGDIDAFSAQYLDYSEMQLEANKLLFDFGNETASKLGTAFGKTEEEVWKLATEMGTNLMDNTKSFTEQLKTLAEAMIDTTRELYNAQQDIFAQGTDLFRIEREALESKEAIDQNVFGLRGSIDAALKGELSGDALDKELFGFFEKQRAAFLAFYKGDVATATLEFNKLYGKGGTAYTQEGGALQGMEQVIFGASGGKMGELITNALGADLAGIVSTQTEFLTANLLKNELQLGEGSNITGLIGSITDPTQLQRLTELSSGAALQMEGGRSELEAFIKEIDPTGQFNVTLTEFKEPIVEAGQMLRDAALKYEGSTVAFGTVVEGLVSQYGGGGENKDTNTPRFGDRLTSALSSTMSAHGDVNSMIPGRRNITSSYRNFALGSLKSDHVTGRALDLTGQNLVSYRDKMTSAGGFAEFHGKGDSRHLHVVPPPAIGDSLTAVSATSSSVSGQGRGSTSINNTNNFYISGTNANEIAEVVMLKMSSVNKSMDERR